MRRGCRYAHCVLKGVEPGWSVEIRKGQRMPLEDKGLGIGAQAPAFELPELDGGTLTLEERLGAPVVLVFYRGSW